MINFLAAIALILFIAILFVFLFKALTAPTSTNQEEVVTTTTTVQPTIDQLPGLKRQFNESGQPFVIDPIDKSTWFLNTNDDMYEDADGKWWKLI